MILPAYGAFLTSSLFTWALAVSSPPPPGGPGAMLPSHLPLNERFKTPLALVLLVN